MNRNKIPLANGFRCAACGAFVMVEEQYSGVGNRNHCPYCLWSRHLDSHAAGDRLSACKARMKPVGLTLKKTRKKYGLGQHGELMLIHLCEECGKISINRIAADDDVETILRIYDESASTTAGLHERFVLEEIQPLDGAEKLLVKARLFGRRN